MFHYRFAELNEVGTNYAWIFKWVNLHCNWINLISVLNFPKQCGRLKMRIQNSAKHLKYSAKGKKLTVSICWLFSHNTLSQTLDRVMPLDYLSCFAIILRGVHGNVDICQIDYSIPSKFEFSPSLTLNSSNSTVYSKFEKSVQHYLI